MKPKKQVMKKRKPKRKKKSRDELVALSVTELDKEATFLIETAEVHIAQARRILHIARCLSKILDEQKKLRKKSGK